MTKSSLVNVILICLKVHVFRKVEIMLTTEFWIFFLNQLSSIDLSLLKLFIDKGCFSGEHCGLLDSRLSMKYYAYFAKDRESYNYGIRN